MFLEGFSFAYEVHGAFFGSGWASRHTYCFKSAQELESSEAYWDELQTNSDDVAMRRLVSEHRVEGVGFTLVVDEVETVSGARIGSRETSISLCVLSWRSSTSNAGWYITSVYGPYSPPFSDQTIILHSNNTASRHTFLFCRSPNPI